MDKKIVTHDVYKKEYLVNPEKLDISKELIEVIENYIK